MVNEFIYIVLPQHLCRINLTQLLVAEEEEERSIPLIETVVYFPDKDFPVGMGAFALDSKLYLVGGEKLKNGKRLELNLPLSNPKFFKFLSDRMFIYNHQKKPRNPPQSEIPPMISPKPCPQVAIVDGKVYVFAGTQYCYTGEAPMPRFECYDPTLNSWEALPNPPFYFHWPISYLYVSVIGRKIFVTNQIGQHAYHVDDRTWTDSGFLFMDDSPFEIDGCVAESSDDGIVVAYTARGLVAYRDGTLRRAQVLKDLNKVFPPPLPSTQASFISYLGGGRYCLLLNELFGRVTRDWDMHVCLFRVEILEEEEEEDFCRAILLKRHVYNAFYGITCDENHPTHVFTMCEGSNKHGCLGVGPRLGLDRASSAHGGSGGRGEGVKELPQLSKTLQQRERILSPTRSLDETLQKPILIRADYISQDEVAIHQSEGAPHQLGKEMALQEVVPPGFVSILDAKLNTKSAKRNRKKKEKRLQQAALDKGKDWKSEVSSAEDVNEAEEEEEPIEAVASQINDTLVLDSTKSLAPPGKLDLSVDKRFRALKKKIRNLKEKIGLNQEQVEIWDSLYRELMLLELQKNLMGKGI